MNEIDIAIDSINRDVFVLQADGTPLLQSTATSAIKKSLQLLDLKKGQQILEIGTGSGYSTADGFLVKKSDQSIQFLQNWLEEWRSYGCPGFEMLKPLVKRNHDKWVIRAELVEKNGIKRSKNIVNG